ncbi:MAG: phosphodiester glycosidase family protein [Candidatus Sumerlaeia bacterium]|nr:phosphodiester glycosidase family protein [Candidatus Sumerlaeia bacterium]
MNLSPSLRAPRFGSFTCAVILSLSLMPLGNLARAGVDVWTNQSVATGVVWKNKVYTSLYGAKQTVNVLEVDLAHASVTVKPINSTTCQKTSTLANNAGAVAAINGGFFGSCQTVSMIKLDNVVLGTNPSYKPARSTFGLTSTDVPMIAAIASSDSWPSASQALGGGPNLVTNGTINVTLTQEGFDSSYASRNPRTALGYTSTNKLLLVTVDGRTTAGAGMTLTELATTMRDLGCSQAMNLDGGGSTTMWTKSNGIINTPSDGTERSVVSALGVYVTAAPTTVTVDNTDAGFTASTNWVASTSSPGYLGTNYRVRTTGSVSDAATWKANLTTAGSYKVYARWAADPNRASAAPYVVYHTGGSTTVPMNQQINGGQWMLLGTFNFASGNATRVGLSCWTSSGSYVVADSIRLEKQ